MVGGVLGSSGGSWSKPFADGDPSNRLIGIGAALALVAVGVCAYLAYANYRTGQRWQERAELAAIDVERLTQENDQLEADLTGVRKALKKSEQDVARLENRVSRAADEKAQVEDEREMVTSYAERVTEIAYAYDQVATQFQLCRIENATFATMMSDAGYYYDTGQWHVLTNQAAAVDAACSSAEGLLNELRSYVDALA
jgi:chromosome segregation ATPase